MPKRRISVQEITCQVIITFAVSRYVLVFDFLQVAAINAEIVDSAMAMKTLTHFFLGLTNEWLESMSTMLDAEKADNAQGGAAAAAPKDSFPIQVSPLWR